MNAKFIIDMNGFGYNVMLMHISFEKEIIIRTKN